MTKLYQSTAINLLDLKADIKLKNFSFAKFPQTFGEGEIFIAKIVHKSIIKLSGSDQDICIDHHKDYVK